MPPAVIEMMRNPRAGSGAATSGEPQAPAPVSVQVVLGDGMPIRLILAEDVSRDAAEGESIRFKVADDIRVNDTVVIRRGAAATGTIVDRAGDDPRHRRKG